MGAIAWRPPDYRGDAMWPGCDDRRSAVAYGSIVTLCVRGVIDDIVVLTPLQKIALRLLVFIGDSGALPIWLRGIMALEAGQSDVTAPLVRYVFPVLVMMMPLLDTGVVTVSRFARI